MLLKPKFSSKSKPVFLAIASLLLSFVTTASHAGVYAGSSLGLNDHGFEIDGDSVGYTVTVGYRPGHGKFGAEVSYINTGSATIGGLGALEMSGTNASIVYWIRDNNPAPTSMRGYLKLGIYNMSATVSPTVANSQGWSAGMGFEFDIQPNLSLYTDLNGLLLVDATGNKLDNLGIWSFGVRYQF